MQNCEKYTEKYTQQCEQLLFDIKNINTKSYIIKNTIIPENTLDKTRLGWLLY